MSRESAFIAALRGFATDPAARGLLDDAAVLPVGQWGPGGALVLTHDILVENVHYLPDDAPADVAWKLLAVNLSDLAAKGAVPVGVLLGYAMTDDAGWDAAFAAGLGAAAAHFGVPILGGDTVGMPRGAPRVLGLTALGRAPATGAPARSGARPGDILYVSGTIGDAALGLAIRQGRVQAGASGATLVERYLRPVPRLALGQAVAARASAMADVSDGLLIDAARMGEASGCAVQINLDALPLSAAFVAARGDDRDARLFAATGGDDYELLFATQHDTNDFPDQAVAIGKFLHGEGMILSFEDNIIAVPERTGYEHGAVGQ